MLLPKKADMKILVIGAGAVGGYFGGRLLEAGRDVTVLVRPRRAEELARVGLVIKSPAGDVILPAPKTIVAETLNQIFDLVLLSCKAYDLEGAIASFAPAVGPGTVVLPLLNGLRHLDLLDATFGSRKVLGGLCAISASLDQQHAVIHSMAMHSLIFGERQSGVSDRVRGILSTMRGAVFDAHASETILLEMWEKWVLLASLAGSTTLIRATIGDICAAPEGRNLVLGLIEECRRIAESEGYEPRPAVLQRIRAQLTETNSPFTASMYRDMERNAPVEADHIIGDLLTRGRQHHAADKDFPLLRLAYTNLKVYEIKRARGR
jgi:2-dehydropantoate 2-reductase